MAPPLALAINRRRILRAGIVAPIAMLGYPVVCYLNPQTKEIETTEPSPLAQLIDRGSTLIRRGEKRALVLVAPSGELRAFNASCPHLGCTLSFDAKQAKIVCPCHGASFDPESGERLRGPAEKGLTRLLAKRDSTQLWVEW